MVELLGAVDDHYVLSAGMQRLSVLDNDSGLARIVDVTQPERATARIDEGVIVIDADPLFTGSRSFMYTISDGFEEQTASVTVVQLGATKVDTAPVAPVFLDGNPSIEATENNSGPAAILIALREMPALVTLSELSLPPLSISGAAGVVALAGFMALIYRRRIVVIDVQGIERGGHASASKRDEGFELRHNAVLWGTGRRSRGRVEVETRNGRMWIDAPLVRRRRFARRLGRRRR